MGARRGGWPAFGRGRAAEPCASRGSRAAACVRAFWLNLALVLPLGVASIILYPGCLDKPMMGPPTPRACTDNANCHDDEYCDPNVPRVCREIIPDPVPFPDADDIQVGLEGSQPNQTIVFSIAVPPGSVNIAGVDLTFPLGFEAGPFAIGQGGTASFSNGNGSITRPIYFFAPNAGCLDFDNNQVCDPSETGFSFSGDGVTENVVLEVDVYGGADGSLTDNIYDVGGEARFEFDADDFSFDGVQGNVVAVLTGVDQGTGDEDDGVEPDPPTEEIVVLFDAATLIGGTFTCAKSLSDGSNEAHIMAADGVKFIDLGGEIPVPNLGGRAAVNQVCLTAEGRGQNSGEVMLRVSKGTPPYVLLGSSPPFTFAVDPDHDTTCVKGLGIDTEGSPTVIITALWDPRIYDLAPAIDQNGPQQPVKVRTADSVCAIPQAPFNDLGTRGVAIGASFVKVGDVSASSTPLVTRTATEPIRQISMTETNLGEVELVSTVSGGQTQELDILAAAIGNLGPPVNTTATAQVALNEPAFSLTETVPMNGIGTLHAVAGIEANRPWWTRIATNLNAQGQLSVTATHSQIDAANDKWEIGLASACEGNIVLAGQQPDDRSLSDCDDDVYAVAFRASSNPFAFERQVYDCTDGGSCEYIGTIDTPGKTDLGGIYNCLLAQAYVYKSPKRVCSTYSTGRVTNLQCTDWEAWAACCDIEGDLPFTPGDCSYEQITPTLPAAPLSRESEGEEVVWEPPDIGLCLDSEESGLRSVVERASLERPKVPGGAYFFVRGFSTETSSGFIDVTTFKLDAAGEVSAGGYRAGLEQVRTVGAAFPDLAVDHEPGTDLFTLCFGDVEGGAQRVRCSQWRTGGDPDPATWRRVATFLAPPGVNRSVPLALAGPGIEQRAAPPALPITMAGVSAPGSQGPFTFVAHEILNPLPCAEGPDVACLGTGDRFAALADWRTPQGATGTAKITEVTADSGVATFFSPDNVELFYKTVDACGFPAFQNKWFFLTGLTNVEVVTSVLDTKTGRMRRYGNPLGRPFQPVLDTGAFATCPVTTPGRAGAASGDDFSSAADLSSIGDAGGLLAGALAVGADVSALPDWAQDAIAAASMAGPAGPLLSSRDACVPSSTRLCLNDGRFAVEAAWRQNNGNSGLGKPVYLTADTGAFTFFNAANLEVLVKVLNVCQSAFNSFWVFAAGLTNVEVTLTVTDTATDTVKHYTNALNNPFQPIQDTSAFKTCQ